MRREITNLFLIGAAGPYILKKSVQDVNFRRNTDDML